MSEFGGATSRVFGIATLTWKDLLSAAQFWIAAVATGPVHARPTFSREGARNSSVTCHLHAYRCGCRRSSSPGYLLARSCWFSVVENENAWAYARAAGMIFVGFQNRAALNVGGLSMCGTRRYDVRSRQSAGSASLGAVFRRYGLGRVFGVLLGRSRDSPTMAPTRSGGPLRNMRLQPLRPAPAAVPGVWHEVQTRSHRCEPAPLRACPEDRRAGRLP